MPRITRIGAYFLLISIIVSSVAYAQAPQITSINGTSPISWIQNGRLIQGYNNSPNFPGKYPGRFLVDVNPLLSHAGLWMTIVGSNFGSTPGTITFSSGEISVRANTVTWSNTSVRFIPQYPMVCPTGPLDNIRITLKRADGQTAVRACSIIQSVQTRPFGQCTWWAATSRLGVGKSIPQPSAYSYNITINQNYRPMPHDVVMWGTSHQAFISSTSRSISQIQSNPPKFRITYTVNLSQYNADWRESLSYFTTSFVLDSTPGVSPLVTIVQGIKFNTGSGVATYAWR